LTIKGIVFSKKLSVYRKNSETILKDILRKSQRNATRACNNIIQDYRGFLSGMYRNYREAWKMN
jgi:hypothetical protein